jgi:hypothetical protein
MICNASYLLKYRSPVHLVWGSWSWFFSELFWFTHLSNLLKPTHVAHFSKISFVWVSQQSLHLSLLVTSLRAFASPWPDIVLLATFPLLRSLYQFTWSIYEDYPASPGISYTFLLLKMYQLSCCLTDHIMRVNNLHCWKNYDTANQYYFIPHAGRSLQFYHVYFPLGKQISSCHWDLVTASMLPGRVNCLISFPPLLLCHWFSNNASQCVKCSFFLQRKPLFQKWFFKRSVLFLKTETLNVCLQQCLSNSGDLC